MYYYNNMRLAHALWRSLPSCHAPRSTDHKRFQLARVPSLLFGPELSLSLPLTGHSHALHAGGWLASTASSVAWAIS